MNIIPGADFSHYFPRVQLVSLYIDLQIRKVYSIYLLKSFDMLI